MNRLFCLFPLRVSDGMISYQIPRESSWDTGQDLSDSTYDGEQNETTLSGGMGRLADGILGGDNFKLDIGYGRGKFAHPELDKIVHCYGPIHLDG